MELYVEYGAAFGNKSAISLQKQPIRPREFQPIPETIAVKCFLPSLTARNYGCCLEVRLIASGTTAAFYGLLFFLCSGTKGDTMPEVNYKSRFCQKYFAKDTWELDVLNEVDVLLKDKKGNYLLYIESKYRIVNDTEHRKALAQVILTNKKQDKVLTHVALIYMDKDQNDILELIDCSDNSVMYNNDFNWEKEKASNPTKDAIDRINDRLKGKITTYKNDEIKAFYDLLKRGSDTAIHITENNFNVVYNQWKQEIEFKETIADEQELINLFLVDILNGTRYKKSIYNEFGEGDLLKLPNTGEESEQDLIREGIRLSNYTLMSFNGVIDGIKYEGKTSSNYYTFKNKEKYNTFWRKYKRPPEKEVFLNILERSATLYSDKYRKDTGGEYTPACFVKLQNEILAKHYNLNDFIVFDPCAGVGNLQNDFGKDFKQYVYLSTLEQMDVDICKIKGFENAVRYDYLKDDKHPLFKYKGLELDINEIAKRENRKLMVIMNPPYTRQKGFKYDLAIEFFNKVLTLKPQVIVYYCKTEFFLRDTVSCFVNSNYNIISHVFSNAKKTFKLSEWSISQIIFDREKGAPVIADTITATRYDYNAKTDRLNQIKDYTYNNAKPDLIKEIEHKIKENKQGLILGQWCYLSKVMLVSNGGKEKSNKISSNNLKYCLLSKGINFNTHAKYFEWNYLTYRGRIEDIPEELFNDAVMFSLFYKNNQFSNKGYKNYIMPFTAEELGCNKNDLNVLFPPDNDLFSAQGQEPFDFREFMRGFTFSKEAKDLYRAALEVFKFYHKNPEYTDKNYNDSFYDITNAIMGKDTSSFKELETDNDTRITRTKTTKGTRGFSARNIPYAVAKEYLPIFENFFCARHILAQKINDRLVAENLLLWKRENIY